MKCNLKYSVLSIMILSFSSFTNCEDFRMSDIIDFSCNTTVDCNRFEQKSQNSTCINQECNCFNQNSEKIHCSLEDGIYNNIIGGNCPCTQKFAECNYQSQICYCKKGYMATLDKRRCLKKKLELGESCEDDSQCIYQEKFSECHTIEKVCKCQKDFVEFNKGCKSVVNLSEYCETDDQCKNNTENSNCHLKRCTCNTGFISNIAQTKCLQGAGHNHNCSEDNQCKLLLGVGSTCYSGKCSCDIKHQLLELKLEHFICVKDVRYGDYCLEHNDCYRSKEESTKRSMECVHAECGCSPDFVAKNNICVFSGAQSIRASVILTTILMAVICFVLGPLSSNSILRIYDL